MSVATNEGFHEAEQFAFQAPGFGQGHPTQFTPSVDRVEEITRLVGADVVLLPIRTGQKAPSFCGWQETTIDRMHDPAYRSQLNTGNVGVLLGGASGGLCSIDIDDDACVEPFLQLNPSLAGSLRTRGSRGANIWIRIQGEYPTLTKLKTTTGLDWGEWRADGGQTVISGTHPLGIPYQRIVNAPPVEIAFEDIKWPNNVNLPWRYADLIEQFGEPFTATSFALNERFFVGKFSQEHRIVYEPISGTFFGYKDANGLWEPKTDDSIKEQFCRDLKDVADETCERRIITKITDRLTSSLTNMLKGHVERHDAFKSRPTKIHVQNGMLDLTHGARLDPFSPTEYSRNQIKYDWEPEAQCPRFINELLTPMLSEDDISLLQRWAGCALLGINKPQRFMILTGEAGTGKSTIATIVEGVIGVENVGYLRTEHLNTRFELMSLANKTLLAGKDVPGNYLNQEGAHMIKSLCGDDFMEAEQKNGGRCQIRGDFNILITSNSRLWLKLDGDEGAWRRRLLIIEFTRQRQSRTIPGLANVLLREEGPGILRWMVEGAVRLKQEMRERGDYVLSEPQRDRVNRLVSESNSLRDFISNAVVREEGGQVTTETLVQGYTQYCQARRWHVLPATIVLKKIPDAMMDIHCAAASHDLLFGGTSRRGYHGFVLREVQNAA